MISCDLIDEIIYVSLKNEIISKELTEDILINMIEQSDEITQNYFSGLSFEREDWDFAIATCDLAGKINIDYEKAINYFSELNNKSFLEKNIEIIQFVVHEIMHLKELSKKRKENYESKIIKLGCMEYINFTYFNRAINKFSDHDFCSRYAEKKYKQFCQDNWNIIPTERIAEGESRKIILVSLDNYPNFSSNYLKEFAIANNSYINSLKNGYKILGNGKYSAPIIDYFTMLNKLQVIKKLGFDLENKKLPKEAKNFDIETKMMYGFPIKTRDMIEINKKKIMTRR